MIVTQGGAVLRCGLYVPGHDVHWIQANRAFRREADIAVPGHLLEVRSDGLVLVEVDGGVRRLWNHDPISLEAHVAHNNGEISHQPSFGLLHTPKEDGYYLFCVVDADAPGRRPCPARPPTGDPMQLLREAGGFSMPGPDALRWIESSTEEE